MTKSKPPSSPPWVGVHPQRKGNKNFLTRLGEELHANVGNSQIQPKLKNKKYTPHLRNFVKGVFFIMKKSKLFKTISFSSLALLMGIAGTMAFAPLGASPNNLASANEIETTIEQGLITPKADDPVIYTTESGLEIKWGNAAPTINNSLPSGTYNLTGFPYFSTTADGTTYDWVIIGRSPDTDLFQNTITNYLFSTWKTARNSTIAKGNFGDNKGYYFFNNTYEATTPAGSAINGIIPSKSYVADYTPVTKQVISNPEIDSGCVLVLLNGSSFVGTYNTTYAHPGFSQYKFCNWGEGYNMTIRTTMEGYYTNKSLGLGTITDNIQNTLLKTYECNWENSDGWVWRLEECYHHIFPLCATTNGGSNFMWSTYLTAAQMENGFSQALRAAPTQQGGSSDYSLSGGVYHYKAYYFEGQAHRTATVNATGFSYRPAFVLKIS